MLYKLLRSTLIPLMNREIGFPVIEANSDGEAPAGTYATFDSLQPLGSITGRPIETYGSDGRKTIRSEVVVTLTFTAYADDKGDCIEACVRLCDYLRSDAYLRLKDAGIVLVEIGDMTTNDLKLGDTWEYRAMADAEFRMTHITTSDAAVETIETADVKGES